MKRLLASLVFLICTFVSVAVHAQSSGSTPPPPPVCSYANAGALYTDTGTSPATVYTCSYYNLAWQWVINPSYGGLVYYPTVPATCEGALPAFLAGWPNTNMYVCVNGFPELISSEGGINHIPFCAGFSPAEGQTVEWTALSTPNPCWTAATGGGGGGATWNSITGGSQTGSGTSQLNTLPGYLDDQGEAFARTPILPTAGDTVDARNMAVTDGPASYLTVLDDFQRPDTAPGTVGTMNTGQTWDVRTRGLWPQPNGGYANAGQILSHSYSTPNAWSYIIATSAENVNRIGMDCTYQANTGSAETGECVMAILFQIPNQVYPNVNNTCITAHIEVTDIALAIGYYNCDGIFHPIGYGSWSPLTLGQKYRAEAVIVGNTIYFQLTTPDALGNQVPVPNGSYSFTNPFLSANASPYVFFEETNGPTSLVTATMQQVWAGVYGGGEPMAGDVTGTARNSVVTGVNGAQIVSNAPIAATNNYGQIVDARTVTFENWYLNSNNLFWTTPPFYGDVSGSPSPSPLTITASGATGPHSETGDVWRVQTALNGDTTLGTGIGWYEALTVPPNTTGNMSIWIKLNSGSTCTLNWEDWEIYVSVSVTVTSSWQQVTLTRRSSETGISQPGFYIQAGVNTDSCDLLVAQPQVEFYGGAFVATTSATVIDYLPLAIPGGINLPGAASPMQSNGNAGTTGQVLTSQGPGATPVWEAGGGGGNVGFTESESFNEVSLSGNWVQNDGTYGIDSTSTPPSLHITSVDAYRATMSYVKTGDVWNSNQQATVTLQAKCLDSDYDSIGPAVNVQGTTGSTIEYYAAYVTNTTNIAYLFKQVGTTVTVLNSASGVTLNANSVETISNVGGALTFTLDGNVILTATDTSITGGTPGVNGYAFHGGGTDYPDTRAASWVGSSLGLAGNNVQQIVPGSSNVHVAPPGGTGRTVISVDAGGGGGTSNTIYSSLGSTALSVPGCTNYTNISTGGGTSASACLQAQLDALGALASGGKLVFDHYYLIDATNVGTTNAVDGNYQTNALQTHSNVTIDATNGGVFLAASSNVAMLGNAITGNPAATLQTNMAVIGGIWNANLANQSRYEQGSTSNGWVFGMFFGGFNGLNISNVTILNATTFCGVLSNGSNAVLTNDTCQWSTVNVFQNNDGWHFWGPLNNVVEKNFNDVNGDDDTLPINTDEGCVDHAASPSSWQISRYPWSGGAISNLTIDGVVSNSTAGIRWWAGAPTSGCVATVSNITVNNYHDLGALNVSMLVSSNVSSVGPISISNWMATGPHNDVNVPATSCLNLSGIYPTAPVNTNGSTMCNTFSQLNLSSPLYLSASAGTAAQALTSQGSSLPPAWSNVISWVTAPTETSSPGALGQAAISGNVFYWYDGTRWQRVIADATWVPSFVFVQGISPVHSSTGSVSGSFTINNTAGSLLTASVNLLLNGNNAATCSISDTAGNTWVGTGYVQGSGGNVGSETFYVLSAIAGANTATVTCTPTGGGTWGSLSAYIQEWNPEGGTPSLDGYVAGNTSNSCPTVSSAAVGATLDDLLIEGGITNGTASAMTMPGLTVTQTDTAAWANAYGWGYGTAGQSLSLTGNTGAYCTFSGAAFKSTH